MLGPSWEHTDIILTCYAMQEGHTCVWKHRTKGPQSPKGAWEVSMKNKKETCRHWEGGGRYLEQKEA